MPSKTAATEDGLHINYPNGDTVARNFPANGTSAAATIKSVDVRNNKDVLIDAPWQHVNEPGTHNGNFSVSIVLPHSATSDGNGYSLTITDSDGKSDTKTFKL